MKVPDTEAPQSTAAGGGPTATPVTPSGSQSPLDASSVLSDPACPVCQPLLKGEDSTNDPEDPLAGLIKCEWCGGSFDSSDMCGEHCHACAEEIFGGD